MSKRSMCKYHDEIKLNDCRKVSWVQASVNGDGDKAESLEMVSEE